MPEINESYITQKNKAMNFPIQSMKIGLDQNHNPNQRPDSAMSDFSQMSTPDERDMIENVGCTNLAKPSMVNGLTMLEQVKRLWQENE